MVFVVAFAVSFLFLSQAILPVAGSSCTLQLGDNLEVNGCDWLSFLEALEERLEDSDSCGDRTLSEELEYLDEEFQESVGKTTKDVVDTYCAQKWETYDTSSFSEIDGEFTDDFMNQYTMGLTHLNSNTGNFQGDDVSERNGEIGENIDDFRDEEAEETLMESFGAFDTSTCEGQAIMCCFGRDRQFGDDNGNCDDDDCEDADPADNSNLCYTESRSYPDDDSPENDIHCHGLAWGEDPNDFTGKLAFNNFFYVSLYDHMYSRGYVERTIRREDDAAEFRMCDCVENMPVVTRSDCTEVEINSFDFSRNAGNDLIIEAPDSLDVEFNACEGVGRNNDLSAYIRRLVNEGRFGEDVKEYNLKYERKWPHCENVKCYTGTRTREFMQYKCDKEPNCDGFSFTTNSDTGWGCLKECGFDDSYNGYGSNSHDYWEKQVPQAYETLVGYRNPDDNDNEDACEAVSPAPTAPVQITTAPTPTPTMTPSATPPTVPPVENVVWEEIFAENFDGTPNSFNLKRNRFSSSISYEGNSTMLKKSQKMSSPFIKKVRKYSELEIEFWYYGENLVTGDKLILETKFDKNSLVGLKNLTMGSDFDENDKWQHAVLTLSSLGSKMRLHFRVDNLVKKHHIYVDKLMVRGAKSSKLF